MQSERLAYAVGIVPSARQLAWQRLEFYGFLHFGMNTFTNREWGDGSESPALFHPEALDARQWAETAKRAGMKGLILTCKHHDGFCLWPSAYTTHSVKYSPWKQGKGDVVREVADACREAGLRFGVYLSPWDRHEPTYGSGADYDTYYIRQLTELATGYGEIFCFWFDGACGEGAGGRVQQYNWPAYYEVIRKYQPGAVISVCGPDVRWCGNEAGHARESEWSVVPAFLRDNGRIAAASQQEDDGAFSRRLNRQDEDLGSRAAIGEVGELVWYPAEVDTSIRPGWFYHPEEDAQVRSAGELFQIYLDAVGGNAALLLNLPPDTSGRIAAADQASMAGLGQKLREAFAHNIAADARAAPEYAPLLDGEDATWWQAGRDTAGIELEWPRPVRPRYLVLGEYLPLGQRVEAGEVWAGERRLAAFTVIGHKRICVLPGNPCTRLTVRITASRAAPALRLLEVYE